MFIAKYSNHTINVCNNKIMVHTKIVCLSTFYYVYKVYHEDPINAIAFDLFIKFYFLKNKKILYYCATKKKPI